MSDLTEHDSIRAVPTPVPITDLSKPSLWLLLRVWLMLGVQSFGGGTATLFMIRRAAVEQYHWLSDEEFTHDWAICQAAPGINLLGITILIGWRVGGLLGSIVALTGLILPSVSITIVMTAFYAQLQQMTAIQAALRGIVPATVGLGILLSIHMAQPLLVASRREGHFSLGVSIALFIGSTLAFAIWDLPVLAILCGAGVLGAGAAWWQARGKRDD